MSRFSPGDNGGSVASRREAAVENAISTLLRYGVLLSLICITTGTVLSFATAKHYGRTQQDLQVLMHPGPEAGFPRTLPALASGLARLEGHSIIVLGLISLILTPVLRVAVSIYLFAVQRDRVFTALTILVFLLLVISLVLGSVTGFQFESSKPRAGALVASPMNNLQPGLKLNVVRGEGASAAAAARAAAKRHPGTDSNRRADSIIRLMTS